MQQAYLVLLEGKARYGGDSGLKTWLYAVIRNMARRYARSGNLERRRVEQYGYLSTEPESAPPEPDEGSTALVRQAIQTLPERQRQVLELVIDADLTLAQSATVLGISIGSARTHYHRAKQTLRSQLEQTHAG
jgi:RNA polymerase sigma-70 factor (ECF subfamily)